MRAEAVEFVYCDVDFPLSTLTFSLLIFCYKTAAQRGLEVPEMDVDLLYGFRLIRGEWRPVCEELLGDDSFWESYSFRLLLILPKDELQQKRVKTTIMGECF